MRKFTKLIAPALIATIGIGGLATGASAAPLLGGRHQAEVLTPQRNAQVRADIQGLRANIDRAQARDAISPREAKGLRVQATQVGRLYTSYAHGGLSAGEVSDLQHRVDRIHGALHMEARDGNGHRH